MFFKILILAIIFVALAGIAIALKYFNQKRAPLCSSTANPENANDCRVCGASVIEDCTEEKVEKKQNKNNKQ